VKTRERIPFTITPEELARRAGWRYKVRSSKWLDVARCPFCRGGEHGDEHTFIIHRTDGNYACLRSKCGARGSFWKLIEHAGFNPRDFVERTGRTFPGAKLQQGYRYGAPR
jgi:hypothetical protein